MGKVQEIKDCIVELFEKNEQLKLSKKEYEEIKEENTQIILDFMDSKKVNCLKFTSKPGAKYLKNVTQSENKLQCKKVQKASVLFDANKLESNIKDKKILEQIIIKDYSINNIEGLIDLCKKHGIKPKEFKKFIDVNKTVDNKKIDDLYELGKIKEEDIKDCYQIKKNKPYLMIKVL